MASKFVIDVGRDFTETPSGRVRDDGDFSGQRFREDLLVPALKAHDIVEIVLDTTEGFGSSFLDEAFGGLVTIEGFSHEELRRKLTFRESSQVAIRYATKIRGYLEKAAQSR